MLIRLTTGRLPRTRVPVANRLRQRRGRLAVNVRQCDRPSMLSPGRRYTVTARALLRQRPVTATSIFFIIVEDEAGVTNVVVWSDLFERQRHVVF